MRRLHVVAVAICLGLVHLSGPAGAERRLILSLVVPPPSPTPPPIPVLAERAASALAEGCVGTRHGADSLGDLLPMRQGAILPALDADVRRMLAAAYVSQSPVVADELLAPLRSNPTPAVRYLGALVQLHVRLRAGGPMPTDTELEQLQRQGEVARLPTSDVDYFRALSRMLAGDLQRARDAALLALNQEPLYFNATMTLLEIDLKAYRGSADALPRCRAALANLVDTLQRMTDLSPCPLQAIFVDTYLDGITTEGGDSGSRLARAYLAVLSRKPIVAMQRLQSLGRDLERERVPCAGEILAQVERMLKLPLSDAK